VPAGWGISGSVVLQNAGSKARSFGQWAAANCAAPQCNCNAGPHAMHFDLAVLWMSRPLIFFRAIYNLRFTIRSGVRTGNYIRWRSAISGSPLPERTDFAQIIVLLHQHNEHNNENRCSRPCTFKSQNAIATCCFTLTVIRL